MYVWETLFEYFVELLVVFENWDWVESAVVSEFYYNCFCYSVDLQEFFVVDSNLILIIHYNGCERKIDGKVALPKFVLKLELKGFDIRLGEKLP